jgi:hypothetical protein
MDTPLRDRFTAPWQQYFPGAELPPRARIKKGPGTAEPVPPYGGNSAASSAR